MPKEVNKPYAHSCVERGDAYRLCICDHLTDDKKTDLKDELRKAVQAVKPDAPEPSVLDVDDVAALANRYPAIVMMLEPLLALASLHFDAWGASITDVTPIFVPGAGFEQTKTLITAFVNLQQEVPDSVLLMQGEAGVGKTRTAYESLKVLNGARNLVLYTDDEEHAVELATLISNDPTAHAIIVADECSIGAREQINRRIKGHRNRVRAIAIDNNAEVLSSIAPELKIEKMTSADLEKVLKANFPAVPADRLRSYSHLAEGFIRPAADMCKFDPQIKAAGSISPVIVTVHEYYKLRLKEEQRIALEAISLFRRVGHKGDAAEQLDEVCGMLGLQRDNVEQQLASIKDAPGFIERGAKYYRVTPEIIAIVAFESAWKRLAEGREDKFLEKLPKALQESFLERVSASAKPEVRNTVQTFFRNFALNFKPGDLGDLDLVNRFVTLVETSPLFYLPLLKDVIEKARPQELTSSPEWIHSSWGPRRQLVWLAERLAQFPEFFDASEAILYQLAVNESEPKIGNNATAIWRQLYRMQLSGTAVPFSERLYKLRARAINADAAGRAVVAGAFEKILDFHSHRVLGPPVVAGRIPPPEWLPKDYAELKNTFKQVLAFLLEFSKHEDPTLAEAAQDAFTTTIETLLRYGYLAEVESAVPLNEIREETRAKLASNIKQFISFRSRTDQSPPQPPLPNDYLQKLSGWIEKIAPTSLHGRLVEAVGASSWGHYGREEEWHAELNSLAVKLLEDNAIFLQELLWLVSPEAKSAGDFGHFLGAADAGAKHLDMIVERSFAAQSSSFLKGYILGELSRPDIDISRINKILDELEERSPVFALDVSLVGGDRTWAFERATRMIREHKLSAAYLRVFTFWIGNRRIETNEVIEALELLLHVEGEEASSASDVMLDFLGSRLHSQKLSELVQTDAPIVWRILEAAVRNPGREAYWWSEIMARVADQNPALAVELATRAMVSDEFQLAELAQNLIALFAGKFPNEVMDKVGKMALDKDIGWHFLVGKFSVFTALPFEVLQNWLERNGVEAARKIARHVPRPFLNAEGKPSLHPLTEFLLTRFEDDDLTFNEFCAGVHSFQLYVGDLAAHREAEAKFAEAFFNHPLRRIREWAQREWQIGRAEAELHRMEQDERGF
ncbi:MAG TPA: hypothetical protein VFR24_25715 [Candidatus Angelobacter sp.]|nr:hypothetical protein [Candidatus Angelobacter sp.]